MSYFQPNGMLYVDQVSDWREAVDLVTRPLLDAGTIERGYVDAIKTSIASPGGTYIDLGEVLPLHMRGLKVEWSPHRSLCCEWVSRFCWLMMRPIPSTPCFAWPRKTQTRISILCNRWLFC